MNSIRVDWDNPDETILYVEFASRWSTQDLFEARQQLVGYMQAKKDPIHIICDAHAACPPARGIFFVMSNIIDTLPVNTGKIIVLSDDKVWQSIIDIIWHTYRGGKFNHLNIAFADTVASAYMLLEADPPESS